MNYLKIIITLVVLEFSGTAVFCQGIKYTKNDTIRYIVKNEVLRFLGSTFWSGVEIPLENKKSIYLSGIVAYGTPIGNSNEALIGWGGEFQYRSYLGKGTFVTNAPIYLSTQFVFRRMTEYTRVYTPLLANLNGYDQVIGETITENRRGYNVYYGGILLGYQLFMNQIFTIDLNFGGGIRLTQIDGEKSFSRYKTITSLDYSGVVPRIGVIIGIIQH